MTILSRLRQLLELPANLDAAVRAMEGKHVADCREINRGCTDRIQELESEKASQEDWHKKVTAENERGLRNLRMRIAELECSLETSHEAERALEGRIAELTNENNEMAEEHRQQIQQRLNSIAELLGDNAALRGRITDLESELANARDAIKRQESSMATLHAISARRDELEMVLATTRDSLDCANNEITDRKIRIDKLEGKIAQLKRNNTEIDSSRSEWIRRCNELKSTVGNLKLELGTATNSITELESTIASLRSGALPWRPIGERTTHMVSAFRADNGSFWIGYDPKTLSGNLPTHFLYLDQPTPKPAPKVVAWAVVRDDSSIVHQYGNPLVWGIENPHSESNAVFACGTSEAIERKYRAVRLVILEDDNAKG